MAFRQRTSRPAPRGVLMVLGGLFAIGGLCILIFAAAPSATHAWEVRRWEKAPCVLKRAETLVKNKDGLPSTWSLLEYSFVWNGNTLSGKDTDECPDVNAREEELALLRAHPPETCRVNPADPSASRMELPSWRDPLILSVADIFVTFIGLVMAWRPKLSRHTGDRLFQWILPACLLIFTASGSLCFWLALRDDWKSVEPRLKQVPCSIVDSRIKTSRSSNNRNGGGTPLYSPEILFRYEWEDHMWHSRWVDFTRNSTRSSDLSAPEKVLARYPAGTAAVCWLDPEHPWVAVLERTHGTVRVLYLCGSIFGGIGLAGLIVWFFRGSPRHRFQRPSLPS